LQAFKLVLISATALFMAFFSYYSITRPEIFIIVHGNAAIPFLSFVNLYSVFLWIVAYNATSNWWIFRLITLEIIILVIIWLG